MSGLYPNKADTLTARNIVDAYRSAYYTLHNIMPEECRHLQGRWFVINGIERDRGWVILEVERLRQEALALAIEHGVNGDSKARGSLFKLIRRLSRF
jgi:hypothetical protein